MANKISFVFFAIACFGKMSVASEDIEIHIPDIPKVELSEGQKERNKAYRNVARYLPYNQREAYKIFTTIGKLCQLCDTVIIGKVVGAEQPIKETNEHASRLNLNFSLNIETNLFGYDIPKSIPLNIDSSNTYNFLKNNERVLIFLANENYLNYPMKIHKWDFDKEQITGQKNDTVFIVGGDRGYISLKNNRDEEQFITAVNGYLRVLRQKQPDMNCYYDLLRQLVLSENSRVREDARSDLLLLIQTSTAPAFDTKRVLLDDNIDDGIKDYLRLYWIPYVRDYNK